MFEQSRNIEGPLWKEKRAILLPALIAKLLFTHQHTAGL